eukprot:6174174-Pleurochrysis_carterae.AAC.3
MAGKGNEIVRGPEGRRKGEVNKPWDWACRDGYGEDGRVYKAECVQGRGVEHSSEGRTVSLRKAAGPRKGLLSREKGLGKAVEIVQLSKDAVDEVKAKNGAPAERLHEGRVHAARNGGKGNKERNPCIGYSH